MPYGLEIVSSRLLNALVRVYRRVTCRAGQVLAIFVGYMLTLRVFKALGKPEINDVDLVFGLIGSTNQEVIRLDVAVNDPLLVHLLDAHQLNIYRLARRDGIFEM